MSLSYQQFSSPCSFSSREEEVVSAVVAFADKIMAALENGAVHDGLMSDLRRTAEMLQEDYSAAEISGILSAPAVAMLRSALPEKVARIETELEKAEARKQIELLDMQGPEGLKTFALFEKYTNLVRKEWLLYQRLYADADLRRMRFVFVGCGAMPLTAVGMARAFGVQVDCYDVDATAAELARRMVEKLGMQDKIGVYHGNALYVDYSHYDAVIVANIARPQMKILQTVAGFANVKMVVARQVLGPVSLMYSSYGEGDFVGVGLAVVNKVDPNDKKSIHQSVLLKRA